MAQLHRPRRPGASIFFSVCLDAPGQTLLTDHIMQLRSSVRAVRGLWPFEINAWVVLPDHLHAIWTLPEGDSDYALRWASIKARFSRGLAAPALTGTQQARREKGIWQRRFWEHHLRGADDLAAHQRLCWADPVRHGLVRHPRDWPYSSYHRDADRGVPVDQWRGPLPGFPTGDPDRTTSDRTRVGTTLAAAMPHPTPRGLGVSDHP